MVVDVMRGGPSTGIPAKSEQSDLSFAVERPARRRAAPGAGADLDRRLPGHHAVGGAAGRGAAGAGDRAVGPVHGPVARHHRPARPTPASRAAAADRRGRTRPTTSATATPPSGVSPMAIPGTPGIVYTADGLEHTEAGIPSSQARDHRLQLDKRERKLALHDYGARWADIEGDGEQPRVITFGSVTGTVREAVARAAAARRAGAPDRAAPARAGAARAPGRGAARREARAGGRAEPRRAAVPLPARDVRPAGPPEQLPPPRPAAAAPGRTRRRHRRLAARADTHRRRLA